MFKLLTAFRPHANHSAGNSDHSRIIGNWLHNNRPRADFYVIADANVAQHLCSRAYYHVISYCRVSFSFLFSRTTQRDILVNQDVIPYLCRLADDDSHAMIDEESPPDRSARMNFDPSKESAELRNYFRQQRNTRPQQFMCKPVGQQGMQPR